MQTEDIYLCGYGFILTDLFLLIDPQALQGQMTGHQTAIDTLRKTAESLITSEGDLLSNTDEIQETVGEGKIKVGSQFCTVYMISENLNDFMYRQIMGSGFQPLNMQVERCQTLK